MRICSYVEILNFAFAGRKMPCGGMSAYCFCSKKSEELFSSSKAKKTSLVMRDCLTLQVRQQKNHHHESTANQDTNAKITSQFLCHTPYYERNRHIGGGGIYQGCF